MADKKIRVLIFPAGEINSVELHDALSYCVNVQVYGASSVERHGSYVFENYTSGLPLISAPDFLDKFNTFLQEKQIDFIFPTHDTVAVFLTEHAARLKARVIAADARTAAICRDKAATYEALAGADFLPKIYPGRPTVFPVFIKPRNGQGGLGAKLLTGPQDIPAGICWDDYVVCQYLPGEEFTVDCLTDKDGKLAVVSPRSRRRLMAGVCVAGQTEPATPQINHIAKCINEKLHFLGLWFFQIKKDENGQWKLLEVSTRAACSMCLTRARGLNLPLLSVYAAAGLPISARPNSPTVQMDRTLISRYKLGYDYQTVYFDFDDTLTLRGKVNLKAIWFLYQCKNQGKKVILLTKHEKDLQHSLKQYAICPDLFDEIIHIAPQDKKASYIRPEKAIFIDNAYQERAAVAHLHNIPVFDADGLDVLMDWKV